MSDEPLSFGPVAPYYEELMAGVPYALWLRYLRDLWAKHGQTPRTVLDLACGTGAMTRLLAEAGYAPVGVDLSAGMLEAARNVSPDLEFVQQDAADLDLDGRRFDGVISLFDSLNYIIEPARLAQAFRRVADHLAPGGAFIFDLNTEYALSEGMFSQSSSRKDAPLHYRWRSKYDPESRLCTVRMHFSYDPGTGERQRFVEVHRQRAYGKEEIVALLRAAGFSQTTVYDAYTTDPPKRRSDRLFFVAIRDASGPEGPDAPSE